MEDSIVILAGGKSERLGTDKALVKLAGKPLIMHVLDRIEGVAGEVLVVVSSKTQKEALRKVLGEKIHIITDKSDVRSPLVGASTGFKNANGKTSLLLSCDTPFISREAASFLLEVCKGKAAAIPRWPDGKIEPLQAAYNTKMSLESSVKALKEGKMDMRSIISKLRGVRYISTLVIREFDPELLTFFNVNTLVDLKRAERILKERLVT